MLVDGGDLLRDDHEGDGDPTPDEEAQVPTSEVNYFTQIGRGLESFNHDVAVVLDVVDERGNDLADLFEHVFSFVGSHYRRCFTCERYQKKG